MKNQKRDSALNPAFLCEKKRIKGLTLTALSSALKTRG
jgi:hypothetical protein